MRRVDRQLSVFFLPLARTSHRFQTTDDLSCFFRPTIPARAAKDARLHRIRDFDFPILELTAVRGNLREVGVSG